MLDQIEPLDVAALTPRLADPAFFMADEFQPLLRWMRDHSPIHWTQAWKEEGFWSVSRHGDIQSVLDQPLLFSSQEQGNRIPLGPTRYRTEVDPGAGFIPASTDPPRHGLVRKAFTRAFVGPVIAKYQADCHGIVNEIVDTALEAGSCDLVSDVATPLPTYFICQILGIPRSDWGQMAAWANGFANASEIDANDPDAVARTERDAQNAIYDYVVELVKARRIAPRGDLVDAAIQAEVNGERLLDPEVNWWVWSTLVGGLETARNVITSGMHALIENPEQQQLLREQPTVMQPALDEMLRWATPVYGNYRTATADTQIGEQAIRKGDGVVTWGISGNRDDRVFADPFSFDIRRNPNPHLTFVFGVHNCIGRMVALMEIRLMVARFLERTRTITLNGPNERTASTVSVGFKSLPVRFEMA